MRKKLKNNHEVAHFWANQSQSEGRGYSMEFYGPSIYSWGRHWELARLMTDKKGRRVAFLQWDTCSPSTGKHASIVRGAASHLTSYYVPNSDPSGYSRRAAISTDHVENVRFFMSRLQNEIEGWKSRRTGSEYSLERVKKGVAEINEYMTRFDVKINKFKAEEQKTLKRYKKTPWGPLTKEETALFKKYEAREKLKEERERQIKEEGGPLYEAHLKGVEARERQAANKLHAQALKENEAREKWLSGEAETYPAAYGEPVKLRVKGDRIETSGRAEISVKMALKFWETLKAGESVEGFNFGPYQAQGIDEGGILRVGCHRIPRAELERVAQILGV